VNFHQLLSWRLGMVWGRVLTVLDSPVNSEEAKWSSTPKCRPPRAAGSRCACHLSGLLKPSVFFRLPRRLTKQRLQATPTPLVMLLQSPSVPTGHEELESSPQSSWPNKSQPNQIAISTRLCSPFHRRGWLPTAITESKLLGDGTARRTLFSPSDAVSAWTSSPRYTGL